MSDAHRELGGREFVVTEIVEIEPPDGESRGTWYRYTIEHGLSPIEGIRSGTLKSVRRHAEEFAENLNQRALYGYSAYAARKVKQK
jgi:hypothetical protein